MLFNFFIHFYFGCLLLLPLSFLYLFEGHNRIFQRKSTSTSASRSIPPSKTSNTFTPSQNPLPITYKSQYQFNLTCNPLLPKSNSILAWNTLCGSKYQQQPSVFNRSKWRFLFRLFFRLLLVISYSHSCWLNPNNQFQGVVLCFMVQPEIDVLFCYLMLFFQVCCFFHSYDFHLSAKYSLLINLLTTTCFVVGDLSMNKLQDTILFLFDFQCVVDFIFAFAQSTYPFEE